jgi:hypothetical protein
VLGAGNGGEHRQQEEDTWFELHDSVRPSIKQVGGIEHSNQEGDTHRSCHTLQLWAPSDNGASMTLLGSLIDLQCFCCLEDELDRDQTMVSSFRLYH